MSRSASQDHIRILYERARNLRRETTPAEVILWKHLRGRRFSGWKFRRQQPINEALAIADFLCCATGVIVELDGETHVGREVHDSARQGKLERLGFRVLRFWNHEVYEDIDAVLDTIWFTCDERSAVAKVQALPLSAHSQVETGRQPYSKDQ